MFRNKKDVLYLNCTHADWLDEDSMNKNTMSASCSSMKFMLSVCIKKFEECHNKRKDAAFEVQKRISGHMSAGSSDKVKPHLEYIAHEYGFSKVFEVLGNCCAQLLKELGLFFHPTILDGDIGKSVSNIIWADYHLEIGVPQFWTLAKMLIRRFGTTYASMAKKNIFSNVSDDLISMQNLTLPSESLTELLDLPNVHTEDTVKWLKSLFHSRSRSNSTIELIGSKAKSNRLPRSLDNLFMFKRGNSEKNTRN